MFGNRKAEAHLRHSRVSDQIQLRLSLRYGVDVYVCLYIHTPRGVINDAYLVDVYVCLDIHTLISVSVVEHLVILHVSN
jgi:hypothetical protein